MRTHVSSLSLFINSVLMSSTRQSFDFWKCVAHLEGCSPLPSQTLLKCLSLDRRINFSAPAAARDDSNASTFCVNFATSLFCMQTNCQRMAEYVTEAQSRAQLRNIRNRAQLHTCIARSVFSCSTRKPPPLASYVDVPFVRSAEASCCLSCSVRRLTC
jgi:hypothetical protein